MTAFEDFRSECMGLLKKAVKNPELEKPPKEIPADLAFPTFALAKEQKRNPVEIARDVAEKISKKKAKKSLITRIEAAGPYVNFFADWSVLSSEVINEVLTKQNKYGKKSTKKETIMIESPGPNTNKPLHVGHLRNAALGQALANILEHAGYRVVRVDIVNDRGVHICKSMLAYKKFGNNKQPDKKSDHFVGDFYVLYAQQEKEHPELEDETQQMLVAWEQKNKDVFKLWKQMNEWALSGLKQTYDRFGIRIDKAYFESDHYLKGKELILAGLKKKLFAKDEKGNIIVDLDANGLGKKILLRADGTAIYMTQDIAVAKIRFNDYHMNRMIYVVGSEQKHHFQVLFKVFEMLKFPFAKKAYHLAYGMVFLPEGKMKSREGKVVDADTLMDEVTTLARHEIQSRSVMIDRDELQKRAEQIGIGAIKYFLLKFEPSKDFVYDPEKSISFDGDSGPYMQYTHARACSILRKATKHKKKTASALNDPLEITVVKKVAAFPESITKAADEYKPSIVATSVTDLAASFNELYHAKQFIGAKNEAALLALTESVAVTLRVGLKLLGIDAPEKM